MKFRHQFVIISSVFINKQNEHFLDLEDINALKGTFDWSKDVDSIE